MDREGGEKAHPETIRVLPSPSVFLLHLSLHPTPFVSRRFSHRGGEGETEFHIITSRNDGEREREKESCTHPCPMFPIVRRNDFPLPLLRIIPSFRPRYFLAQPSNNGRGWEEDLGEKLWFVFFFFVVFFCFFLCVIVIVNFWFFATFWSYDFHERFSEVLEK